MEEILKRFEQQDSFIDCFKLLERWKDVPHFRIKEAVDLGILFPFTRSFDHKTCEAINLPVVFSSICDSDGDCSIDVEEATRQDIVFSLANVLLLENKYPKVFTPKARDKDTNENNAFTMSLISRNEELSLENNTLRIQYSDKINELNETVSKLNRARHELEYLESKLSDYRKALAQKADNILPCIGHGGCRFICDELRKGIKEKKVAERLYAKLGVKSKSAIGFVLCTNSKLENELALENNSKDDMSNKRKRLEGYCDSIMGYPNKQKKENSGVEQ